MHLTSCEPVRDPGFSKSECLELARKIDRSTEIAISPCFGPDLNDLTFLNPIDRDTIIAALRAYAK